MYKINFSVVVVLFLVQSVQLKVLITQNINKINKKYHFLNNKFYLVLNNITKVVMEVGN